MNLSWSSRAARFFSSLIVTLALSACTSSSTPPLEPLDLPDGCNPLLAGIDCMLPFPSNVFLVEDASLPTGHRVEIPDSAVIHSIDQKPANVFATQTVDGFSKTPPILAILGSELSNTGLTHIQQNPETTLQITHPTLLIDTSTGALVPHFAELDPRAFEPLRQALILRPMVELKEKTRYIVALHNIKDPEGEIISAPEGFRRLRDDKSEGDPILAPLAARYEVEIFPQLKTLGIERKDLQLAWDFTTSSHHNTRHDLLTMKRLVSEALEGTSPQVEIHSVTEDEEPGIWRTIRGSITGPSIMDSDEPGGTASRDAEGNLQLNGEVRFPFTAQIPDTVKASFNPGAVLQFGHGFFGSRAEAQDSPARTIASQSESVLFAIDWWGMSNPDRTLLIEDLTTAPSQALRFGQRVYQAMANWMTLNQALETSLMSEAAFTRPLATDAEGVVESANGTRTNAGNLVYDPAQLHFLGISQGAVLGTTYTAITPKVSRSILNVGGAGLTHMIFRSNPLGPFILLMQLTFPDPLDQQKFVATLQSPADRFDPSGFASLLKSRIAEESQHVLMQVALGDTQVPNWSSFLNARIAGLHLIQPSPVSVFGLASQSTPHFGSGLTAFDLGADTAFSVEATLPGDINDVHNELRLHPAALSQMKTFLQSGTIVDAQSTEPRSSDSE